MQCRVVQVVEGCVSVHQGSELLLLLLQVFMVPRSVAALTALHKLFLS